MNFNIQGLNNKLFNLELLLTQHNINVACLSETWCGGELETFAFGEYRVVTTYSRKKFKRGGVAIVAEKAINARTINFDDISRDKVFEICGCEIEYSGSTIVICALYRSPGAEFDDFLVYRVQARLA